VVGAIGSAGNIRLAEYLIPRDGRNDTVRAWSALTGSGPASTRIGADNLAKYPGNRLPQNKCD
jgi:hypothetical protein